jgi:hypothetical protein
MTLPIQTRIACLAPPCFTQKLQAVTGVPSVPGCMAFAERIKPAVSITLGSPARRRLTCVKRAASPVWTSAAHIGRDFALLVVALALLGFWRVPSWAVVLITAVLAWRVMLS